MSGAGGLRIAVVSRDGVGVDERLHRACDLFVFERRGERGEEIAFVERRALPARAGRPFRDFPSLAAAAHDCGWIVALGFNGEARRELAARGFRLSEARGPIDEVIRALPADSVGRT